MTASRLISTHIRGHGHALFSLRDTHLELKFRSDEELDVDRKWINKTGLIAEGLAAQPYLHLDIRTPFGESVNKRQVEDALAESLGPRKDRYRLCGWHIQFVEDTNLGSNHRVLVDLNDTTAASLEMIGMDTCLSLEVAVEALGDLVAAEKGEMSFQFLFAGAQFCYSLLYLNGSPFHVLRVGEGAGPKAASRLRRHRDFAPGFGRNGTAVLKTYLLPGDPLWNGPAVHGIPAETVKLKQESISTTLSQTTNPTGPTKTSDGNYWLLHLGLAHAARQKDFAEHNRVPVSQRLRNTEVRTRSRFLVATAITLISCAFALGIYGIAIQASLSALNDLKEKAAVYQNQVDSIKSLRMEKARLQTAMLDLRPLWHGPMDWGAVLGDIAAAIPMEGGVDGFVAGEKPETGLEISFRAWVRDWNQIQGIEKKLSASPRFSGVSLSEQRKDMATGVVIFNVTCKLVKN